MEPLTGVLLTAGVAAVLIGLAVLGWRGRLRRQRGYADLPQVPQVLSPAVLQTDGQYVVTTTEGDWLDRVAVHGLGVKANAVLSIHAQGVLLARHGATDVFIPAGELTEVRTEAGMAGKFVEAGGLVVISWQLGGQGVDTAFRTRHAADKPPLLQALTELLPAEPHGSTPKDTQ